MLPSHSSSVRFSSSPPGELPAHVTSTSICPKRSSVAETARSMSWVFVMSPWIPSTRSSPPSSWTARRSVSSSRPVIATRQPSCTSSSAVARPMPRLAPVMSATASPSPRSICPSSSSIASVVAVRPVAAGQASELLAAHLPHPVDRQLLEGDHPLGAFEGREALAAVRDQLVGVDVAVRHDERDDLLAPALRGHAGHHRLRDARVLLEHDLHLARVDVQAPADDELLAAAGDLEAAVVRIQAPEVAGPEPAVGRERLLGRLRTVPVAPEYLRAAHEDLAGLVVVRAACDPQLDAGQRPPHPAGSARPVVEVGDVQAGLGAAVAVERQLPQPARRARAARRAPPPRAAGGARRAGWRSRRRGAPARTGGPPRCPPRRPAARTS